jgi:hypothetical protein
LRAETLNWMFQKCEELKSPPRHLAFGQIERRAEIVDVHEKQRWPLSSVSSLFLLLSSSGLRTAFAFEKLIVCQKAVDFADSNCSRTETLSSRLQFPHRPAQLSLASVAALIQSAKESEKL